MKDLDGNIVPVDNEQAQMIARMAKANWCQELAGDLTVETVYQGAIHIPSSQLQNKEEELKKQQAEVTRLEQEIKRGEGILSNPGFLAKAPEKKVNEEKEKLANYKKQLETVLARIHDLQNN